jgi:hypothetical protein
MRRSHLVNITYVLWFITLETLADKEGNSEEKSESEEQWVFFDDQVGVKKGMDYVAGSENNQRNCYMALYELN